MTPLEPGAGMGRGQVTTKMTLEEWRAQALENGSGSFLATRFECPLCHRVSTPADFIAAGAKGERAAQECIGRVIGAVGGLQAKVSDAQPCDWAAFGLFGTLNGGTIVTHPDGTTTTAFSFAVSR